MRPDQRKQTSALDNPACNLALPLHCSNSARLAACSCVANVMISGYECVFLFGCHENTRSHHNRWSSPRTEADSLYFLMPFFSPTLAGAAMEVRAYRLTLKAELLISRIRGGSKRTIKGGVFGSEGSLTSQHMDMAMKKTSRRSLITERCCAYTRTHAG